jgi:hypothetical protein
MRTMLRQLLHRFISRVLLRGAATFLFPIFMLVVGTAAQENSTPGAQVVPPATINVFEIPGSGTAATQGTFALGMNDAGTVTGLYLDSNGLDHGFLRGSNGTITPFDVPQAGTASGQGTWPQDVNIGGTVAGLYYDANNLTHGFVRDPSGVFCTIPCLLSTNPPPGRGAAIIKKKAR